MGFLRLPWNMYISTGSPCSFLSGLSPRSSAMNCVLSSTISMRCVCVCVVGKTLLSTVLVPTFFLHVGKHAEQHRHRLSAYIYIYPPFSSPLSDLVKHPIISPHHCHASGVVTSKSSSSSLQPPGQPRG